MANKAVLLDQEQFSCSICLDLLKSPVTLPCGHSYCSSCIEGYWNQDEQRVYSCPQCREIFTPRPALRRNNILAEVVEKLKETGGAQAATPSELMSTAGSELVTCDLCAGPRKQSALMTCLVCLLSYCETHLQPHRQVPRLKKHKLVKATCGLEDRICSRHDKLLEVFCRTDQQCVCLLCVMDEHKGHDTVSVTAERTEKQSKLGQSQQKVQQRVQEREKELKELRQAVESLKRSGQAAEEDSERVFTELISSIEKRRSDVKKLIRLQQRGAVSQAEGVVERLEQEIAELRRRDAELEKLSHTDDHIHFLQSYRSLSSSSVSSDLPSISLSPPQYFSHVTDALSALREKLEDMIKGEWTNISLTVFTVDVFLPFEPKTRAEFLHYSCQLTLDPNTANKYLSLSEENRTLTSLNPPQPYPHRPQRFMSWWQVLCTEALSGCCYWEVEWRGIGVDMAVSYEDISGANNRFGYNDKSWNLQCSKDGYFFSHNNVKTKVSGPQCSRVGVYLNHKAGSLSFYSICDTITLLHRVQTTFTQPLYPGFGVMSWNDSVKINKLW